MNSSSMQVFFFFLFFKFDRPILDFKKIEFQNKNILLNFFKNKDKMLDYKCLWGVRVRTGVQVFKREQ